MKELKQRLKDLKVKNVSIEQWNILLTAVKVSAAKEKQPSYFIDSGIDNYFSKEVKRFFCYDNCDRWDVPGLDFLQVSENAGVLTVWNGSEQARAPITFEQGLEIAQNFFNSEGYQLSENIVCDYIMEEGAKSVF